MSTSRSLGLDHLDMNAGSQGVVAGKERGRDKNESGLRRFCMEACKKIAENAPTPTDRMATTFIRNRSQHSHVSRDTTRIPKLQQLPSCFFNHQATDSQSSLPEADSTTHTKEEASSLLEIDFEGLDATISDLSEFMFPPPNLYGLTIKGCKLEVVPDDLLDRVPLLRDLNLKTCFSLKSFPYSTSLTNLTIIKCGSLEFLPSLESKKKLVFLESLSIGNSCHSLTTLTINLFPKLKYLNIWDCPNLLSLDVTGEFTGDLALEILNITNCPGLKSFPEEGLHTPNLISIFLSNCQNLNKLPSCFTSLTSLESLCLEKCPHMESFHYGSLPSSLTRLTIAHCDKLTPQKDWGLENLESLTSFTIIGGCIGMESFPEEKLLPKNIKSMEINSLENLKRLDYKGFEHLKSLKRLEIYYCGMLEYIPERGFPKSLSYLCIWHCPMLSRRLNPKTRIDFHKLIGIDHIEIDGQMFTYKRGM